MFAKKYLPLLLTPLFFACNKDLELKPVDFDASAQKSTIATTESAVFNLSGNPDYITFYSGEPGRRYQYRNRVSDTSTNVQLNFSTATTTATNGTLSLLISSDFNGLFDSTNVRSATWTNITSRATLATGTTTVASGTVSLADFAAQRKPVYLAFRYTAAPGSIQRKWTISGLTLDHVLPDKTYNLGNMTATAPSLGWQSVDVRNSAVNWTSALVITGATTAVTALDTDDWIIMGPIDLSRVQPDAGVAIKSITENMNKFPYAYKYSAAGTYTATFEAGNVNRDKGETVVKTVPVTVQ